MFKRCRELFSHITLRNWVMLAIVLAYFGSVYTAMFDGIYKNVVLLPCGLGSLLYMLVKRKIVYDRFTKLLTMTCGFLVLATILNRALDASEITVLATYLIFILFAASTPKNADPHALRRETTSIAVCFLLYVTPFMVLVLASVFTGHPIAMRYAKQLIGIQQDWFYSDRPFAFGNPNADAPLIILSMFFAIYLMHQWRSKALRGLLGAAFFVLMLALAHTQSRTSLTAFSIGIGAVAFRYSFLHLSGKRGRAPLCLLIWIASAAAAYSLLLALFSLDVQIAHSINASREQVNELTQDVSRVITTGPLNLSGDLRTYVWKDALRYLVKHPQYLIFGMGPRDIMTPILTYTNEEIQFAHVHNAYLALLARGGLLSLGSMLAALAVLVRPAFRLLVAPESEERRGAYILPIIIGMFLIISIAEVPLFASKGITNFIFFFSAGHIMRLNRQGKLPPTR